MMNKFLNIFNKRSLKYGSLSILLVVAVIAIAVVVNLFIGMVQDKGFIKKVDLSQNQLYSIGSTSKDVLKGIKNDVIIYALFDNSTVNSASFTQLKSVLDLYGQYKHITIKYIDPDKNPGLLKEIDPNGLSNIQKQDIVVKGKTTNKIRVITSSQVFQDKTDPQTGQSAGTDFTGEQSITGAIKYVASDKTPVVYFTQGHEEPAVDSNFSSLKTQLESNNYEVKSINLLTSGKIPADAAIILVASPQADLNPSENKLLKDYIGNGGNAVFLFDYLDKNPQFPVFEDLLANYNVGIDYDKVTESDTQRYYPTPNSVILDAPQSSIIPQNYQLLLKDSRSIKILKNQKEYITCTSLAKTSSTATGVQVVKSAGNDIKGPMDLAVAVDYKGGTKPGKVLLIGNGVFVSDAAQQLPYFQNGYNFFTMSLNWMMDKTDEVVIDAKSMDSTKMNMSSQAQANTIAVIMIVVLPLVILGFGTFIWLRRRHL